MTPNEIVIKNLNAMLETKNKQIEQQEAHINGQAARLLEYEKVVAELNETISQQFSQIQKMMN